MEVEALERDADNNISLNASMHIKPVTGLNPVKPASFSVLGRKLLLLEPKKEHEVGVMSLTLNVKSAFIKRISCKQAN